MRILQLHAGYRTPAGEDTVVNAEAAALRSAGHDVEQLIAPNPSSAGAAISALARSRYNRRAAAIAAQRCEDFAPDLVHVHNTWFAQSPAVIDAAADAGVPLVMTLHNYRLGCLSADLFRGNSVCTKCVGHAPLAGVVHGCYRGSRALSAFSAVEIMSTRRKSILDRVDRFVAPSGFMADRLVDIGIPKARLTVKPHFTRDPGVRATPPSTSNEVLFIGRLAEAKGIRTLLRAWERLTSADPETPLRLTVIGDGPYAAEARESAPRGVSFPGWMSHDMVEARMLAARAFVFPSEWYEPFGMVLIEAMAAGLPVVTTNASDAATITGTDKQLVTSPGDADGLAECLSRLDDATVDTQGKASRDRFVDTYTEAAGIVELEALYRSVIDEHRR